MSKSKYDLSLKRIASRVFITGVVGIIFGIAMMPFLTTADDLLFSQKSAIGGENVVRMIFLWGLFTAIVVLATFWRKRFRMVGVLLVGCWVISIVFGALIMTDPDSSQLCKRSSLYPMPKEFTRALNLIEQRYGIDEERASGTVLQSAFNYVNCLNIQYLPNDSPEYEGYFLVEEDSDLQDLKIFVSPIYKNLDDLTLATLLSHELAHAGQQINEKTMGINLGCYVAESQAFVTELAFVYVLNDEERRSIYTRLQDSIDINPSLAMFLQSDQRYAESYDACLDRNEKGSTLPKDFDECVWRRTEAMIELDIIRDPLYKEHCDF